MSAPAEGFAGVACVAICFDAAAADGDAASRDVFIQIEAAELIFRRHGIPSFRVPVCTDLGRLRQTLTRLHPDVVLNLVESLDGLDRLQTVIPLVLESWGIPFTGCGSASMLLANDKVGTKRLLHGAGIAVPECGYADAAGRVDFFPNPNPDFPGQWILKPLDTHASMFMDDTSVVHVAEMAAMAALVMERQARHHIPFFAERFVDGREFNLSILERDGKPTVLPAAEIRFTLPHGKPHIVGYAAKWDETSAEYQGTCRVFPESGEDAALVAALSDAAMAVWHALGLSGYARVDFRVDGRGKPLVLEANANPCLSPDAGFAAAAAKSGLEYGAMLGEIIAAGFRKARATGN